MSADLSVDLQAAREIIATAGAALTAAGRKRPDAAVPWCPDWTVSSVLRHIGCVHEWVAGMVNTAASELQPFPSAPEFAGDALADWADECRHALLEALSDADPDRPMWVLGSQRPTRFWARRQAHETAVHAVDATAAAGEAWRIPGDVADDGLVELLTVFLPVQWHQRPPNWGDGRTVHFHRTDGEGERILTSGQDLLLWAVNRPSSVELIGDAGLAAAWADHVRF